MYIKKDSSTKVIFIRMLLYFKLDFKEENHKISFKTKTLINILNDKDALPSLYLAQKAKNFKFPKKDQYTIIFIQWQED